MLIQKTKTVTFRISDKEYRRMREACTTMGVQSLSELARCATTNMIQAGKMGPVEREVLDLRSRAQTLSADILDLEKRLRVSNQ